MSFNNYYNIKTISNLNTLKILIFADDDKNKILKYKSLFNKKESIPEPVSIECINDLIKKNFVK